MTIESLKKWKRDNPEKRKKSGRVYFQKYKEKVYARIKRWRDSHKEEYLKKDREYKLKKSPEVKEREADRERMRRLVLRYAVLSYYSKGDKPVCARCPTSDIRVLAIDHIYNDGAKERRMLGKGNKRGSPSMVIYKWIIENNFPPRYQILCHNCNFLKRLENE